MSVPSDLPARLAVTEAELASFISTAGPAGLAQALLRQQKDTWEMLQRGYDTLRSVRTRAFAFDGFTIKVQFNPGRLTSTSAKVDAHTIRERPCFLCTANLPPDQRGLLRDGSFVLLCNPFPIFPEHFTISALSHSPQLIRDSFSTFLELTRVLGGHYTVFYNGPKCGASAPDHLHFQAGNQSFLPLTTEYETLAAAHAAPLARSNGFSACAIENCLRRFVAFESGDAAWLERAFAALHDTLAADAVAGEEPMLNILGFFENNQWRILCFPRAKHRPSFYFKTGEEQLLVSPAAVELGGVCTTPRECDFEKITREHIVELFEEVCVSAERFAGIKARLAGKLAALG